MDERQKYLLILCGVVLTMLLSLITIFAVLLKSIQKIDQKMNHKSEINITILNGFYGNPYK